MSSTRRVFLARTASFCAGLTFYRELLAAQPHLAENDPAAQALGYKSDAATVDRARFPKYQPGQNCATCQFFAGQTGRRIWRMSDVWQKGCCRERVVQRLQQTHLTADQDPAFRAVATAAGTVRRMAIRLGSRTRFNCAPASYHGYSRCILERTPKVGGGWQAIQCAASFPDCGRSAVAHFHHVPDVVRASRPARSCRDLLISSKPDRLLQRRQ